MRALVVKPGISVQDMIQMTTGFLHGIEKADLHHEKGTRSCSAPPKTHHANRN